MIDSDEFFTDQLVDSESVGGSHHAVKSTQVTLFELFFLTTLTAVAIGIWAFVSQLLALVLGGAVLVACVVKWSGVQHMILGGLVGFFAASVVVAITVCLLQTDVATTIGLSLLCPAAGYIAGTCIVELSNNDLA